MVIFTPSISSEVIYLFTVFFFFLAAFLLRSWISRNIFWLIYRLICWVLKALVDSFGAVICEVAYPNPASGADSLNQLRIGVHLPTEAHWLHHNSELSMRRDERLSTEDHPSPISQLCPSLREISI